MPDAIACTKRPGRRPRAFARWCRLLSRSVNVTRLLYPVPLLPSPSTARLAAVSFTPTFFSCKLGSQASSRPFQMPAFAAQGAEVPSGSLGLSRAVLVYTSRSSRIDSPRSDTHPRPRRPLAGARRSARLHGTLHPGQCAQCALERMTLSTTISSEPPRRF